MRWFWLTLALLVPHTLAQELTIHFIDVGHGEAVLIQTPDGQSVLYNGGGDRYAAYDYLHAQRVLLLDLVIASHPGAAYTEGLAEVLSLYQPNAFIDNASQTGDPVALELRTTAQRLGVTQLPPNAQAFTLGEVTLSILPPPMMPAWGAHNNSVGVVLEYGDFRAALTGAAGEEELRWWRERYPELLRPVDVYKGAYFGTAGSDTPFTVGVWQPEAVVLSVGRGNLNGQPLARALDAYQEADAELYRTDQNGNVVVRALPDGSYQTTTQRAHVVEAEPEESEPIEAETAEVEVPPLEAAPPPTPDPPAVPDPPAMAEESPAPTPPSAQPPAESSPPPVEPVEPPVAEPDEPSPTPDAARISRLFDVAQTGSSATLREAVAGADINARDAYGQTPLMYAAANNSDPNVIVTLINLGASLNTQSEGGFTALMFAARDNPNPEVLRVLLTLNADVALRNSEGRLALDYARDNLNVYATPPYNWLEQKTRQALRSTVP